MTPCPPHPPFNPAEPWWTWACPECRPELQRAIDHRDIDMTPSRIQCPWCLNQASHRHGRYAKHTDDTQQCRGSLLSDTVAKLLLRAATEQRDQGWFTAQPAASRGGHVNRASTADTTAIIGQLIALRHAAGTTQADTARNAATDTTRLSTWETRTATPGINSLAAWAESLGTHLQLTTPDSTTTRLRDARQAATALAAARISRGATQADVARAGRLNPANLSQWENGAKTPRLESLAAWAHALGATIQLAPEGTP